MDHRRIASAAVIALILIIVVATSTLAQNRQTYDRAKFKLEAASDIVISKLVGYLPRFSSIIEPKLGQYYLRGNEPAGSKQVSSTGSRWDGNWDGCEVTIMSRNHKINSIQLVYRCNYLNIAKAANEVISKIRTPNKRDGNTLLEFWDHQTKLVVKLTEQGFQAAIFDLKNP